MAVAKEQIRVWVSPETRAFLEQRAAQQGRALSEVACEMLEQFEAQLKAGEASPWLESMLDAVLAKYFDTLPQVLDRLVFGAIENRQWFTATMAKLIELTGDRDRANQDRRVKAALDQITAHVRAQTDEFFATIGQDAFIPEPSPDGALPGDA